MCVVIDIVVSGRPFVVHTVGIKINSLGYVRCDDVSQFTIRRILFNMFRYAGVEAIFTIFFFRGQCGSGKSGFSFPHCACLAFVHTLLIASALAPSDGRRRRRLQTLTSAPFPVNQDDTKSTGIKFEN